MNKKENLKPTDHTSQPSGSSTQESSTKTPAEPHVGIEPLRDDGQSKQVVQFEEVRARNPIMGNIETIRIEKPVARTDEERTAHVKKELEKYGLQPLEQVVVRDLFTGQSKEITLDRTGTSETKLIVALADPKLTRDQKDHFLSMYLFERGKESTSFVVDLMRYKGEHTKESRVFQSRMRFDFETFVNMFISHLNRQADAIAKMCKIDIREEKRKLILWLMQDTNEGKGLTYLDYHKATAKKGKKITLEKLMFIEMAINDLDEAERLMLNTAKTAAAREAQKGGGIYIGRNGNPYNVNDPDLDEIIKKDREILNEAELENSNAPI